MRLPGSVSAGEPAETVITSFGGLAAEESATPADMIAMCDLSYEAYPALAPRARRYRFGGFAGEPQAFFTTDNAFVVLQLLDGVEVIGIWRDGDEAITLSGLFAEPKEPKSAYRGAWFGDCLYLADRGTVVSVSACRAVPMRKTVAGGVPVTTDVANDVYLTPGVGLSFAGGLPGILPGEYLHCSYTRAGAAQQAVIRVERVQDNTIYADMSALEPVTEIEGKVLVTDTWPSDLKGAFRS